MHRIYLDNNSTTLIHAEVATAIADCYRAQYANAASQHEAGRRTRRMVEDARDGIGALLGVATAAATCDRVIFTSGGTEANNLAIRGLAGPKPGKIIISAIEHPSISEAARTLERQGFQLQRLPVDQQGVVAVDELDRMISSDTRLVSVMLGNHETGVLQPIHALAQVCSRAGVPLHTDAVQAVGKIPVDFQDLGVAAMTLSAHKFHGPRGIGALIVRHDVVVEPILHGGFQQLGVRPGTEPVELVAGMYQALKIWEGESRFRAETICQLRDRLESQLLEADPAIVVNGGSAKRLPHTSNVSFPGVDRQALMMALDLAGVDCSTGSACASGSSEPSPVLVAMQLDRQRVESALRFSLSYHTRAAEMDEASRRILMVFQDLRRRNARRKAAASTRTIAAEPL